MNRMCWILRLTLLQDLDKHLGDVYPSIIGMFQIVMMNHQGEPQGKEKDRELEIIQKLAESVLPFAEAISGACDICAELDCLLCFAEATNQYNYTRPQMSEENVISIKQGRYVFTVTRNSKGDGSPFLSTGTHYRSKPSIHLCQMTSSLSAERELVHTRLRTVTVTTTCFKEVYLEIALSYVPVRTHAGR